ncbi:hypothetical protein [Modestobacter lacusdianchii]
MDDERSGARGPARWLGWGVVAVLAAAVVAGTVVVTDQAAGSAAAGTPAARSTAPTATTSAPTREVLLPTPTSHVDGPLPEVAGRPVGEAVPALEAAGALVEVYDARAWGREVGPDWQVCGVGEIYLGDGTPTGQVSVPAVPAGDPCP